MLCVRQISLISQSYNRLNQPKPEEPGEPSASYFSTKQSRYCSLKRTDNNLPKKIKEKDRSYWFT